MMRWILLLPVIGLLVTGRVAAQNTFYAQYGGTFYSGGHIAQSPDKGFFGATYHLSGQYLIYYKVDREGDLVWMRHAPFTPLMAPTAITTLSDSSFAFLARQQGSDSTFVFKVDGTGDLLWIRTLYVGSSANFQALAPTTDGGMVLTGGGCAGADMILHLDAEGHILSQHTHRSQDSVFDFPNALDMVHDGDNMYSYVGFAANGPDDYRPLAFWRSDSAGNVYSYREVHLPYGMALFNLGRNLARSTTGGHYIRVMVNDPVRDHVVLLYLDEQDDLAWCKDVAFDTDLMDQRGICSTLDGGCVMVGTCSFGQSPSLDLLPFAVRFNEAGDLVWSRFTGDADASAWDLFSIHAIEATDDGGFFTVPHRNSVLEFCKVDAAFNGYCFNSPFAPVITDLAPAVIPLNLEEGPLNFVEGTIESSPFAVELERTDLCFYTGIAERSFTGAISISPNPAAREFSLQLDLSAPETVEIVLVNALGSICAQHRINSVPGESNRIDATGLVNGAYTVFVLSRNERCQARLIVQR